jgi:hypothetical protein
MPIARKDGHCCFCGGAIHQGEEVQLNSRVVRQDRPDGRGFRSVQIWHAPHVGCPQETQAARLATDKDQARVNGLASCVPSSSRGPGACRYDKD